MPLSRLFPPPPPPPPPTPPTPPTSHFSAASSASDHSGQILMSNSLYGIILASQQVALYNMHIITLAKYLWLAEFNLSLESLGSFPLLLDCDCEVFPGISPPQRPDSDSAAVARIAELL